MRGEGGRREGIKLVEEREGRTPERRIRESWGDEGESKCGRGPKRVKWINLATESWDIEMKYDMWKIIIIFLYIYINYVLLH